LFANLKPLNHEWDGITLLEPLSNSFLHHRRRERAKRFPPLDLGVEHGLHVGAAGVTEDRAVAERTRSPLHATLKPTDHLPLGNRLGGASAQCALITNIFNSTIGGGNVESVCVQDPLYLPCIKRRPPIGMVHHEIAFAPQLMPDGERRTDRAARIAGRRLYVDPSERRVSSNFAVGDGVHRTAAR